MSQREQRNTTQIVRIDNVDVIKNEVHCVGKDGGRFTLKVPISNGFYRIPKSGENWIVRRNDINNWYFEGVVANESAYGSVTPQEGDIVIESLNNINMSGHGVYINNAPLGVQHLEEFDILEETNRIVLEEAPIPIAIQVFNNGLLMPPSGIIIREKILLFDQALSVGKVVVYYMRLPVK